MSPTDRDLDRALREALSPETDELARIRTHALRSVRPTSRRITRFWPALPAVGALVAAAILLWSPTAPGTRPATTRPAAAERSAETASLLVVRRADGSWLVVQPGNRRDLRQRPFLVVGDLR